MRIEHHFIWVRHNNGTMGLRCAHCHHNKAIEGSTHYDISATTPDQLLREMCEESARTHRRLCRKYGPAKCPPTPRAPYGAGAVRDIRPGDVLQVVDEWEPA